jgi:dTDP-4-dehydrorhamnose reductase
MKNVYITGHRGYVGRELVKRGFIPLDVDITNYDSVSVAVQKARPDLLIHLAGKSDVEYCEQKHNQEEVIRTNVRGSYFVFENLKAMRLPGIFISTDQIWRGGFFEKHRENSRPTPPVNFYGMSKVSAEAIARNFGAKIIRTSYLFDHKRLEFKIEDIGLPKDYPVFIKRSFLHVQDFCDMLEIYCNKFYKMPPVLHLSGSSVVSWYSFMKEIAKGLELNSAVKPRFFEKKGFAPRPWFGGLNTHKSWELGFPQRDYIDGIERMKNEG